MSRYTRAKREDAVKPSKRTMRFSIGNVWNSLKDLNIMCNDKANEVIKYVEFGDGEEMKVPTPSVHIGLLAVNSDITPRREQHPEGFKPLGCLFISNNAARYAYKKTHPLQVRPK